MAALVKGEPAGDAEPAEPAAGDESAAEAKIKAALAKLSEEDRKVAILQKFCVTLDDSRLGSMGAPIKIIVDGQPVFICCAACKKKALADPQATLAKAAKLKAETVKSAP